MLRARLGEQAKDLARRAEALNARRLGVFGGTELRLVGTERIRTEHNCVPRDIVAVGGLMLFGFNVFIGLRPETAVGDVFALYRFVRDGDELRFEATEGAPGLLRDPRFERDFGELYRYYRDTRLLQLRGMDGRLLVVFQTGLAVEHDNRVLRRPSTRTWTGWSTSGSSAPPTARTCCTSSTRARPAGISCCPTT